MNQIACVLCWKWHPPMGMRLSVGDLLCLCAGCGLAWTLHGMIGPLALLPLVVLTHFFLFCNIFRIHRRLELIWAGAFVVNLGAWLTFSTLNWPGILAIQTPLTAGLIFSEILHPRYHGLGSLYLKRLREGRTQNS